jgi:hypothetical protein
MEWVNLNVNDSGAFKITFTGLDPMYLEFDSKEEAVKSFESILKSANK